MQVPYLMPPQLSFRIRKKQPIHLLATTILILAATPTAFAKDGRPLVVADDGSTVDDRPLRCTDKGLEFETADGGTSLWFGVRLQSRYDSLPGSLNSADSLLSTFGRLDRVDAGVTAAHYGSVSAVTFLAAL